MRSSCAVVAVAAHLLPIVAGLAVHSSQGKTPSLLQRTNLSNHLPVVYVQRDFWENLSSIEPPDASKLPRLGESSLTNFNMLSLYSGRVCAGEGWFVDKGRAPLDYCRYKNGRLSESIEGRWHGEFDEYALEKIMLGKWFESPASCPTEFESYCEEHADIVVIPSPFISVALQLGWKWKNIWSLNRDSFMMYWGQVRARYFRNGRAPLILVHTPYCWGRAEFLRSLMEQPKKFASRVVIAGIESNLQKPERDLFGPQWSGSALEQLRKRAKQRLDPNAAPSGEPLLFALPYPTSVLSTVSFSEDDEKASYVAKAKRKVEVSFTGNLSKSSAHNWVRTLVHKKITEMGGEPARIMVNTSILCPNNPWRQHCGLGEYMTMWDVAADSIFCLEPPGDTPTRSHFYIAVQSGCVPVLFNGGHKAYQENEPAWFAWRWTPAPAEEQGLLPRAIEGLFQDPEQMGVVYNSSDLFDEKKNIMKELLDMPSAKPQTFFNLRRSLDSAAPLMTFSSQAPSIWLPSCSDAGPTDAFEAFQGIMLWEAWQHHAKEDLTWC